MPKPNLSFRCATPINFFIPKNFNLYSRRLSGGCLVDVWRVTGRCLQGVWRVSGGCLEVVWKVIGCSFGQEVVRGMFRGCLEGFLPHFGPIFEPFLTIF